jgi:glycylpeptide N-tetradecanoyltransferase
MVKKFKVAEQPSTPGLREMKPEDATQVRELLNKYLSKFDVAPVFETDDDVRHWLAPTPEVVWSYVVEVKCLFFMYCNSVVIKNWPFVLTR